MTSEELIKDLLTTKSALLKDLILNHACDYIINLDDENKIFMVLHSKSEEGEYKNVYSSYGGSYKAKVLPFSLKKNNGFSNIENEIYVVYNSGFNELNIGFEISDKMFQILTSNVPADFEVGDYLDESDLCDVRMELELSIEEELFNLPYSKIKEFSLFLKNTTTENLDLH